MYFTVKATLLGTRRKPTNDDTAAIAPVGSLRWPRTSRAMPMIRSARLRELVFGGATCHVLRHATLPMPFGS